MRKEAAKTILATGSSLALVAVIGWLGLRVKPAPYPTHPESTPELSTTELPSNLPEPVRRHFRAALGERVPRIESAVVWGRADFKVGGLWTRMRFKSYNVAGRAFRREMEITWFGVPVLRGSDAYLDGEGSLEITGLVNTSSRGDLRPGAEARDVGGGSLHHPLRAGPRSAGPLGAGRRAHSALGRPLRRA